MNEIKYTHEVTGHAEKSERPILDFIISLLSPTSVLDVGCGNGSWLTECKKAGISDILGVDGIDAPKSGITSTEFLLHDLRTDLDLPRKFDLALCLEVGEHLPAESADNLVSMLTKNANVVLFSAAIPGQGGQYHINEQWPEYWHSRFKACDFVAFDILRDHFWDNEDVLWWYKQNIVLYVKLSHINRMRFKSTDTIRALVHPDLFRKKVFRPKFLSSRKDVFKLLWASVKVLVSFNRRK